MCVTDPSPLAAGDPRPLGCGTNACPLAGSRVPRLYPTRGGVRLVAPLTSRLHAIWLTCWGIHLTMPDQGRRPWFKKGCVSMAPMGVEFLRILPFLPPKSSVLLRKTVQYVKRGGLTSQRVRTDPSWANLSLCCQKQQRHLIKVNNFMMFGGFETIEAYEDDLYREESSSELSIDSEVEFQLYSQVHYAQDLDTVIREEVHEENSGNSASSSSKPNPKNLIILSDSEVIQLSDGSEVITLSDEDSIYRCKRKNFRAQAKEKKQGSPTSLSSDELADRKCKRDIEKPRPEERSEKIREVMIIEVSSSEEEESTISESDNVENWMLLGCESDDKDDDILLNIVGCENSVNEDRKYLDFRARGSSDHLSFALVESSHDI
ncbi:Zinc finger CCHC domain-containing protein 7 [Galemys pyrenaicus]|uniref:Zinc finger CCHC domain-containing protein 7 n=1 Tax=Galemys pyrenaicus TaxID=202257 RepID=A0A8J6A7W8_GALPY|nr:Zinc finger CCHC domain-containing protein 7 [Galemys pyrenaicus]